MFYAYPANPVSTGETIGNAIAALKQKSRVRKDRIRFHTWVDLPNVGKNLVASILREIDRSDVFACDLTYPNPNVAFELGYSIAKFKRVWITLDRGVADAEKNYKRLYFGLIGAAYAPYMNSEELTAEFLSQYPTSSLDDTILGDYYRSSQRRLEVPTLLYCKPPIATESVIGCVRSLDDSVFDTGMIVDDPVENTSPTLDWYTRNIAQADAVLVHLLSNAEIRNEEHNVKCSLVAGLAQGLGARVMMVVKEPFEAPIDYSAMLMRHATARECEQKVGSWLDRVGEALPRRRRRRSMRPERSGLEFDIRHMWIGDHVAENERSDIDAYFLETSSYLRAIDEQLTIVVGRKGSGKSAQLYAMENELAADPRSSVCVIKPVGYETDGLLRVVQHLLNSSERGYLIASVWKFLIYTELLRSTFFTVRRRPAYVQSTVAEERLVEYFERHRDLIEPPFSERLSMAVQALDSVMDEVYDPLQQRHRISEHLHVHRIRQLRSVVCDALGRYQNVHVLMDNLDEPWKSGADVEFFADVMGGLFQVSGDIIEDFRSHSRGGDGSNLFLTIFLRSDIFSVIQPYMSQVDKLPVQRISWHDSDMLRRILDLRLDYASGQADRASVMWRRLFPQSVGGVSTWDYIRATILPRPRDLLVFVRQAIDGAVNRGHESVTEGDLIAARERYSEYAFQSIVDEDDPRRGKLDEVVYEFADCGRIVSKSDVENVLAAAEVAPTYYAAYIDLLCDSNFLAIEHEDGFTLVRDEIDRTHKRRLAGGVAERSRRDERFQVAKAFWPFLGV